ncbi:hypothetical protein ADK86_10880, partial [Streptomyces sp. NRRL F-5755]
MSGALGLEVFGGWVRGWGVASTVAAEAAGEGFGAARDAAFRAFHDAGRGVGGDAFGGVPQG